MFLTEIIRKKEDSLTKQYSWEDEKETILKSFQTYIKNTYEVPKIFYQQSFVQQQPVIDAFIDAMLKKVKQPEEYQQKALQQKILLEYFLTQQRIAARKGHQ